MNCLRTSLLVVLAWSGGWLMRHMSDPAFDVSMTGALPDGGGKSDGVASGKLAFKSRDGRESNERALLMTAVWGDARPYELVASARLHSALPLDVVIVADAAAARAMATEAHALTLALDVREMLNATVTGVPREEYALQRFLHYDTIMQTSKTKYSFVMVADASDVIVQADPWSRVPRNSVVFSLEAGILIKEQPHNSGWIARMLAEGGQGTLPRGPWAGRQFSGCDMLELIGNETVSCSGATLGAGDAMRAYLGDMAMLINRLPVRRAPGMDQGVHNVLVHYLWRGDARAAVLDYLTSPVFTAGFVRAGDFEIDALGRVRHSRGLPAVHHQLKVHFKSWLEVKWHWDRVLEPPPDLRRAATERFDETERHAAATDRPWASVRASPLRFDKARALERWPTERFMATNAAWCGTGAPGFARACAEPVRQSALRVWPIPDKDFRCSAFQH